MSGNADATRPRVDRRVRRTRDQLGGALVALIVEKPFDTITVQDVLDRAGVGRSTFYAHYRDKDDLFLSDVDEFFEGMATMLSRREDPSDRVAPVRELFAHVAEARSFYDALVTSDRIPEVLELGRGHFARGIERRLCELPRGRSIGAQHRAAVAHALAGSFLSLLTWWIDRNMPGSPEEMDDLFHRMVWAGVGPDAPDQT